jgi:hypothetical protein
MHEDYDYNDDEHDYDNAKDPYKHYFKFDPTAWDAWSKWLQDALNDIVESSPNVWYTIPNISGFPKKSFPVNSYFSNTGKGNSFQYLGNNYQGSPIWKKKYFVLDPIDIGYKNHIQSHAVHFINQPHYYKGMFDILN